MEPRTVPNVRQKKMIPRVLVPPLLVIIVVSNLIMEIQVVDNILSRSLRTSVSFSELIKHKVIATKVNIVYL